MWHADSGCPAACGILVPLPEVEPLSPALGASLVSQMVKSPPAMEEIWVWSPGQEDPLEEGMATHPSILDWRIPWIEEPCDRMTKHGPALNGRFFTTGPPVKSPYTSFKT